jgi:phage gp16-like protein
VINLAVDNGPEQLPSKAHRWLLVQVQIARKALAMEEDDYRALLERVTGQRSAKHCRAHELRAVIAEFERMGFLPSTTIRRRTLGGGAVVRKARAMWISLYQLGAIDDCSDAGLEAFGKRQLNVDRIQWASEREGYRLIEALKGIAQRHGWDQRVSSRLASSERIRTLKERLVEAQIARLADAGIAVTGPIAGDRSTWSEARLASAAAELGSAIRKLPKV